MPNKTKSNDKWPIVGHSNIVSYLQNSLENGQLAQAYLLVGPKNVGKTSLAKNFVDQIVYGKVANADQEARIHPDIHWVGREVSETTGKLKKNISIEQIRQLQNKLSLSSFVDSYKVAVIAEADQLSAEAANSLLKTLEEPTRKTILILLAEKISHLPLTIVSRCQVLKFLPVSSQEIFDYLLEQKVDRKKAKTLAVLAFGRPGLAIEYFENKDEYADFLYQIKQFIGLIKADTVERFKLVNEIAKVGEVDLIKQTLDVWTKVWRDIFLIKNSVSNLVSNLSVAADLEKLAQTYSQRQIIQGFSALNLARRYLDANVNPKLTLENLTLNF